ncbi:MAG TPA: hypothetical protein VHG08_15490 [Longimicrobium sp.]|nr:hypothetical protein [Longimicrobium sp.]
MTSFTRAAFLACFAAVLAACDSPSREEPEPLPKIEAGAGVQGRVEPGRAQEYEVVAPDVEFRVLLQATSGSAADTLVAELFTETGAVAGQTSSVGTDPTLAAQATPWVQPSALGRGRLRVRGHGANDGGSYTVRLFLRSPAPETAPAQITSGQEIAGEALDVPGDVDEFLLAGQAGEEWIVFLQSGAGAGARVDAKLVDRASGDTVARVTTTGPTDPLEALSSGRVRLPSTGTYAVRISGGDAVRQDVHGPYRLRVDRVNRAPESAGAALAPGTVAAEAIGSVGDVDEFTFTGTAGQEVNLFVQLQSGMTAGLNVELLRDLQRLAELQLAAPTASLDDAGTGRITLPVTGAYTVRVSGPAAGAPAAAAGAYRLELYPIDRRPEAGGEVRLDGDAVAGAVDRPGDVDEFAFAGTGGQYLVVYIDGPAPARGGLYAHLVGPDGTLLETAVLNTAGAKGYSRRYRLQASGTYHVRVSGGQPAWPGTGAYTVGAYTVSPAPEHVPATVQVGQTITGERIDRPGDLDVFTLAADPGREINVFLGAPADVGGMTASVRPVNFPYPTIFTFGGPMTLDGRSTGRIRMGETAYELVVDPQMFSSQVGYSMGGEFALRVHPIDRAPEGRSEAYTPGQTVTGEPLYPSGDIDEYRFQLAATTTLNVTWQAPAESPSESVMGFLYNEATGGVAWTTGNTDNGEPVRRITLPAGSYRFSVLNPNLNAPSETALQHVPRLEYRFAFIP